MNPAPGFGAIDGSRVLFEPRDPLPPRPLTAIGGFTVETLPDGRAKLFCELGHCFGTFVSETLAEQTAERFSR